MFVPRYINQEDTLQVYKGLKVTYRQGIILGFGVLFVITTLITNGFSINSFLLSGVVLLVLGFIAMTQVYWKFAEFWIIKLFLFMLTVKRFDILSEHFNSRLIFRYKIVDDAIVFPDNMIMVGEVQAMNNRLMDEGEKFVLTKEFMTMIKAITVKRPIQIVTLHRSAAYADYGQYLVRLKDKYGKMKKEGAGEKKLDVLKNYIHNISELVNSQGYVKVKKFYIVVPLLDYSRGNSFMGIPVPGAKVNLLGQSDESLRKEAIKLKEEMEQVRSYLRTVYVEHLTGGKLRDFLFSVSNPDLYEKVPTDYILKRVQNVKEKRPDLVDQVLTKHGKVIAAARNKERQLQEKDIKEAKN